MATWQVAGHVLLSLVLLLAPLPALGGSRGPPERGGARLIRVDERRCLSLEPITRYIPVPRPFMCHPTMPAIPLPPQPDTQTAMLLLGLKWAGWQLCEKPMVVPVRRLETRRVCCPGWLPSRDGGCNTRAPPVKGPCQNGGFIAPRPGPPQCSCPPGFVGIYCQIRLQSPRLERPLPPGPLPPMGLLPPVLGMRPPFLPSLLPPRPRGTVKITRNRPLKRPPVLYSSVPEGMLKKLPPLPPFPLGPISPVFGPPIPLTPRRSRLRSKGPRVLVRKNRPKYRMVSRRPPPGLNLRPLRPRPSVVITRNLPFLPPSRVTIFNTKPDGEASSPAVCQRRLQVHTVRCFQAAGVISGPAGLFNPFSPEILRQICGMGHRLVPCIMANDRACGNGLKVIMARRMLSSFMSSVGRMCAANADNLAAVEADTGLAPMDTLDSSHEDDSDEIPHLMEDPNHDITEHALCENGGTEVVHEGQIICSCPPGFQGWRCESPIPGVSSVTSSQPATQSAPTQRAKGDKSDEEDMLGLDQEQDGDLYDTQGDGGDYQGSDLHPDVHYPDISGPWVNVDPLPLNTQHGDQLGHVDNVAVVGQEVPVAVPTQEASAKASGQVKGDNQGEQQQQSESLPTSDAASAAQVGDNAHIDQQPVTPRPFLVAGLPVWLVLTVAVSLFFIVVVFCIVLCLCVRFRSRRKGELTIEKVPEKKPLPTENFYTVGVPPPRYEVNGIPQLSYEEAKGEMIRGDRKKEEDKEEEDQEK